MSLTTRAMEAWASELLAGRNGENRSNAFRHVTGLVLNGEPIPLRFYIEALQSYHVKPLNESVAKAILTDMGIRRE